MNKTELRIGNQTENGIVIELTENDIVVFDGYAKWRQSKGLEIEPIPLTEEWLIKFGFKKGLDMCSFNKDCLFLYTKTGADGTKYLFYLKARTIEIKYVHQLQNLYFAVTGEELNKQD